MLKTELRYVIFTNMFNVWFKVEIFYQYICPNFSLGLQKDANCQHTLGAQKRVSGLKFFTMSSMYFEGTQKNQARWLL